MTIIKRTPVTTLPSHERDARRGRATVQLTPKPAPPQPPAHKPHLLARFDPFTGEKICYGTDPNA